jgi:lipopolysaccharide transport system permease protein
MTASGRERTRTGESTTISASRGSAAIDVEELWAYRELAYFLAWRDLKVRYRQTVLGIVWAVVQPLLLMLVFSLFLGRVQGIAPGTVAYPLFAFAGLVPWTLFSKSLAGASESLVSASNLIQRVYFPRLLLPVAALGPYVVDFAFAFVALVGVMLALGVNPTPTALAIVPLTLLDLAAALAFGIWLSAANVQYRDVRQLVPFLLQLWLFASPVVYAADIVPPNLQGLYLLNPMTGVIEGFRWALLGQGPAPLVAIGSAVVVTITVFATGLVYFRRVERTFADVI